MTANVQVPPQRVPFLNADGTVATPWYNLLANVAQRVGGYSGALQLADATLDALAALNAAAGLVAQTGADTFTKRSLAGVAGETVITNPAGTAGNPTVGLANVAGVAGVHLNPTSITLDGKGRVTAISP